MLVKEIKKMDIEKYINNNIKYMKNKKYNNKDDYISDLFLNVITDINMNGYSINEEEEKQIFNIIDNMGV